MCFTPEPGISRARCALRSHLCAHETPAGKPRIHGIQWISWISWIFSGKLAIMRVCGVTDAWIFCGFSRDAWISRGQMHAQDARIPDILGILGILGIFSAKPRKHWAFCTPTPGIFRGIFSGTGISTRKTPLRVCRAGLFDAPADKATRTGLERAKYHFAKISKRLIFWRCSKSP